MKICEEGYYNLITGYVKQIGMDYRAAMRKGNIKKMTEIEKHIQSDQFWGSIIGLTPKTTLAYLRDINERRIEDPHYRPEKYDYTIIRDKHTGYPLVVVKKEKELDGES